MIDVSLTTFIGFLAADPRSRIAHIQAAIDIYARKYDPMHDHYRPIRNGIIDMHRAGLPLAHVEAIVAKANKAKVGSYARIVAAYGRWLGRKDIAWWHDVPGVDWDCGDLRVRIKPELALLIDGSPHVVKLYLRDSKLDKRRIDPVLHLLDTLVARRLEATPMLLAVQQGKAFAPTVEVRGMDALLRAEAMSFVTLWRELSRSAA